MTDVRELAMYRRAADGVPKLAIEQYSGAKKFRDIGIKNVSV